MNAKSFAGLVLAAGRSSRMGRDKALLAFDGVPLWQHQRDTLARAGGAEIFLSARPDQEWAHGTSGFAGLLHDAQPGCGPIIGLTAGLERLSDPHLAVLAIDLPNVSPAWFTMLLAEAAPGVGVVGQRDGRFEPLAAVYPAEAKWLAWETVASGDYSLQHFIAHAVKEGIMRVHPISAAESAQLANWNTAAEAAGVGGAPAVTHQS